MSVFISRMPALGLIEMPPVSNVMPFPTSTGCAGPGIGVAVAGDDHPRRGRRAAADREDAAEPACQQLVGAQHGDGDVRLTGEPVDRLLGEPGGVLHVAGGVDQVARPRDRCRGHPAGLGRRGDHGVLRVGDDEGDGRQPRRVRRGQCRGSGSRRAARPRRRRAPRRRRPGRRSCPAAGPAASPRTRPAAARAGRRCRRSRGCRPASRRRSPRRRRCAAGGPRSARW